MTLAETSIPGCFELFFHVHADVRGAFVKTFRASSFAGKQLESSFVETYYTVSGVNVLRGMHLQVPPADQAKLVYCISGQAMDVLLDVRRGSPTFGRFGVIELSAERGNAVYLPRGVAHGFYAREAPAVMIYHASSEYSPALDLGIAWDSFGAPWPSASPLISARDLQFPSLAEFNSPFEYAASTEPQELIR